MRSFGRFVLVLCVLGCAGVGAFAQSSQQKPAEEKEFADAIKDFKVIPGLFTLYLKEDENKVLLEIAPDQIEKIFLCSITREAGDGRYFDSGSMEADFPFVFKRIGKRLQFLHKNVYFRADGNAPIGRAIPRGVTSSLIGSAKIESKPHPDRKSVLIDPTTIFIQDIGLITYFLQEALKVDFTLDKDNSYFSRLKSFPQNTEIEVTLTFNTTKPKSGFGPIADTRSIQHRYHYSLSTLPETGYRPRLADDRVGHFLTMYQDYSSDTKDSPYRWYINRWQLEKTDPAAPLSPPKQPIVFWLENTIPVEYRKAVAEGVLIWNRAFERIGFKDAIVVKQQPDTADWDAGDVRYNTIRWIVMPGGGYAVGPSRTNPFTGQIYDADIRVSADFTRYIWKEYEEYVNPISLNPANLLTPPGDPKRFCSYADGAARQAAFGWSMLEARNAFSVNDSLAQKYVADNIIALIAHEVGHTLGLRHNFQASSTHAFDELQNEQLTTEEGLTGSVMDYTPVNIAPEGKRQGQFAQTTLGTYDYWAIEYAYKPIDAGEPDLELPELGKVASRVADPKLAYGTDEDAFGFAPQGMDPRTNMWDLGNDPLRYYRERIALSKELWTRIETTFGQPGMRYQKFRRVFGQGLGDFFLGGLTATKYVGGVYHRRDHVGDPGGRMPYEPVPAARQREALEFLRTHIFGSESFAFPSSLLNKLAIERLYDFEFTLFQIPRNDYPIHDVILNIQRTPLDRLYAPITLGRLVDNEVRFGKGDKKFTASEMFAGLRGAIWSELAAGRNVNSLRRGLQRAHLAKLVELAVSPPRGTPEDAVTLARADLVTLQRSIDRAKGKLDDITRAHYDETRARIDAALKASVQRRVVPGQPGT